MLIKFSSVGKENGFGGGELLFEYRVGDISGKRFVEVNYNF